MLMRASLSASDTIERAATCAMFTKARRVVDSVHAQLRGGWQRVMRRAATMVDCFTLDFHATPLLPSPA